MKVRIEDSTKVYALENRISDYKASTKILAGYCQMMANGETMNQDDVTAIAQVVADLKEREKQLNIAYDEVKRLITGPLPVL